MKMISMLAIAPLLVACGTVAQRQAVTINNGLQSAFAQQKACTGRVEASPEFDAIRVHLKNPTAAELADTAAPTPAEAELVKRYTISAEPCLNALLAQIGAVEPGAASAVDQYIFDGKGVFADLIIRKITWADAARRMQELKAKDGPAIRAAHAATMQSLAAQHRQELVEQQEFSDRLVTGLAAGAAIYQATHPQPVYVEAPAPMFSFQPPPLGRPAQQTYCQGTVNRFGNIQATCD
jgi:hypothetical protein